MSNKALNAVWQHSTAKGNQRLVLLSIADQADDNGWAFPSHENIQARTLLARRTVQRAVQQLQQHLELAVVERIGTSNLYRVMVGDLADGHHPAPAHLVEHLERRNRNRDGGSAKLTPPDLQSGSRQSDTGERQIDTPGRATSDTPVAPPGDARTIIEPPIQPSEEPLAEPELGSEAALAVIALHSRECERPLCDRGAGHPGPHRDMWFEAVEIALRQPIAPNHASRAARLARYAEDAGHPPEEIIRRAAVIVREWGQAKLTLNSLWEHYEWAGSPLRDITEGQISSYVEQSNRAARLRRAEAAATKPALEGGAS